MERISSAEADQAFFLEATEDVVTGIDAVSAAETTGVERGVLMAQVGGGHARSHASSALDAVLLAATVEDDREGFFVLQDSLQDAVGADADAEAVAQKQEIQ